MTPVPDRANDYVIVFVSIVVMIYNLAAFHKGEDKDLLQTVREDYALVKNKFT